MFEYMSIIISVVSVVASIINLTINKKHIQAIKNDSLERKNIIVRKKNKIEGYREVKKQLQTLSDYVEKVYPSSKAKISIHILKKNATKLEDSIVEHWISLPSGKEYEYIVKNNTDFNSLLIGKNKYFFVSDLSEFESISDYNNENPNYNNWQTSIVFPIKNNINNEEIVGFLCLVSPEKFNDVRKNKRIISIFSKMADLLGEAIISKLNSSKKQNVKKQIDY